jgi:uncharacterized protein (TIGR02271 family)
MTSTESAVQLLEQGEVAGSDGESIGRVGQVYLDDQSGQPSWVTVKTGWFGTSESFVPLDAASIDGDTVRVPYDKDRIKGAPHHETDEPLSEQNEQDLYSYYGLTSTGGGQAGSGESYRTGQDTGTVDTDTASTSNSGEYLTRSEEQLHVGTEKVQTGRARLRKFVVTEQQTVTVPVTREEVRLVREPITGEENLGDVEIGDAAADVVLTEERVVVSKETVPVEKVRLGTETVTEQREVTEAVRKEQIEFDDTSSTDTGTDPKRRKR